MESFVATTLLQDLTRLSGKRRTSFHSAKAANTGFSKMSQQTVKSAESNEDLGNPKNEKSLSFLYDPPLVEKAERVMEKQRVDPTKILEKETTELDLQNLKLVTAIEKVSYNNSNGIIMSDLVHAL